MEGHLTYPTFTVSGSSTTKYINLARDLAAINGKNEEVTTRDGHVYGYMVEVSANAVAAGLNVIGTIPNTWRVRNSFRKFHFARLDMFDQAGISRSEMGKYGQTLRPYFSQAHRSDGDHVPNILDIPGAGDPVGRSLTGGEWTYSQLASSPTLLESVDANATALPLVDTWDIHVLGGSAATKTVDTVKIWDTVGMINAYNLDRMDQTPDADDTNYPGSTVEGLNNPLASVRTQSLTSGEIVDIAKDQEEEKPPYDILDGGDSQDAVSPLTYSMSASGEASFRRLGTIFVPAGLMSISSGTTGSNGISLNVIGKVLCKDMA
jgi:hypothetical protein